ncbi:hypothetical protein C8R47DRAFT_226451 [Mycena vitilis]|nr:hypothetical protein C8R47DRAFT_226451 [Mycena vitilis]
MHRTLSIPEIVGLICEHLEGGYRVLESRADFAALARTCKSFHDPALDKLWRRQNTLAYVLKCLPSDLWEETNDANDADPSQNALRFKFVKTPQPADWTRPLSYARRIRDLFLIPAWGRRSLGFPTSDVLAIIQLAFPRNHICPNLQYIHWGSQGDTPAFHHIRLFLGPKITRAFITIPANVTDMSPLSALRYPELRALSLQTSSDDTSLIRRASSPFVLELTQIVRLTLDWLDRAALAHLSRLAHLKYLSLSKTDSRDLAPPSPSLDSLPQESVSAYPFLALRSLSLSNTTLEFANELIHMLSDCHLDDFYLGTNVLALETDMGELYSAIAGHLSHITLNTIWMRHVHDALTPPPAGAIASYAITGRTLTSLFAFKNITILHLEGPVGFDIDDTAAWDIARAWPKIQSLTLAAGTSLHHPTTMTLHGLRAFATHCKELSDLEITVDASTVPPFDNSPEARISQRALRTLEVAASPISDAPTVAKFLSGLFQQLRMIGTPDEERWMDPPAADEDEETAAARARHIQWKYVEILVPFIASVREEERQWAGEPSQ